jgi:hypothetical protein
MPTTYETDPERLARLRRELAPHWDDDAPGGPGPGRSPFAPDPAAPCTLCRPWQREADHYRALEATAESATGGAAAAAEAALTREAVDRWLHLEDRLREHREVLHGPLRSLPDDARLLAAYADPLPDTADGRLVYREPRECAGLTERSKAFFLLNRHRFGAIVAASMADFECRGREGASESCLRLYDGAGRVLALAGCTAGYGGEGCHGTLWVLRLCGFPEGAADAEGYTRLERTVFGRRAFWLTAGPGPWAPPVPRVRREG